MRLTNGLSAFPIQNKLVFINNPRSLTRNPPNCTILDNNRVFKNFILASQNLIDIILDKK